MHKNENWNKFMEAMHINNTITKNIPQTMSRPTKELPWITYNIESKCNGAKTYTIKDKQKIHHMNINI